MRAERSQMRAEHDRTGAERSRSPVSQYARTPIARLDEIFPASSDDPIAILTSTATAFSRRKTQFWKHLVIPT
jgi:hypothetical protein